MCINSIATNTFKRENLFGIIRTCTTVGATALDQLPKRFRKLPPLPVVERDDSNMRLDRWLKLHCCHADRVEGGNHYHRSSTSRRRMPKDITQSALQKIERQGGFAVVRQDGAVYRRVKCNFQVVPGDQVFISYPHALSVNLTLKSQVERQERTRSDTSSSTENLTEPPVPPQWLKSSDVLFANQDIIAMDKPPGIDCMPNSKPSIADAYEFLRFLRSDYQVPESVTLRNRQSGEDVSFCDASQPSQGQEMVITSLRSKSKYAHRHFSQDHEPPMFELMDPQLDATRFPDAPRLVHRLDKDVQGVLILARNRLAASTFSSQLKVSPAVYTLAISKT